MRSQERVIGLELSSAVVQCTVRQVVGRVRVEVEELGDRILGYIFEIGRLSCDEPAQKGVFECNGGLRSHIEECRANNT